MSSIASTSLLWLRCDKDEANRSLVATLYCKVCRQFEDRIRGMRNFSSAWVTGTTNHRTSNVLDHAKSDQHIASMSRLREERAKAQNAPISSYAPIVRSLMVMIESEKERMKRKFEICYVLAREGLAFLKYPAFHVLAERQGVELGSSYKTADSAKLFIHLIAESQRQQFLQSLSISSTPFFSFLLDGSTDAGNVEQELVFVLFCYIDDNTKEIRSCTRYLAVVDPARTNTEGLIDCLGRALERLGIRLESKEGVLKVEGRPGLVGGGSDGASVNVGIHHSMKAHIQSMSHGYFGLGASLTAWSLLVRMPVLAHYLVRSVKCCFDCFTFTTSLRRSHESLRPSLKT